MLIRTTAGKDRLGLAEWKLQIENKEAFPVFVTLAVAERTGGRQDFDTVQRNVEIPARGFATIKLPKDGNGYAQNAPYRATVRNCRNVSLGTIQGKLSAC